MQSDPRQEWERLTHLYGEMGDEELLEIAEDFGNLTETAQQVLRDELRKRRLPEPATKKQETEKDPRPMPGRWGQAILGHAPQVSAGDNQDDRPREYTWKTLLCECEERERAWQISEVLKQAGIESWIEGPQSQDDLTWPRVMVAADQLNEARAIAARPIPQEIVDQSKVKEEEFEAPKCPKCGAEDPLLLGVDPANTWQCENCDALWTDVANVENAGRN
ncbi:MAG: hypothetical protein WCC14_04370 [Acidobacteriaceae bacterium]